MKSDLQNPNKTLLLNKIAHVSYLEDLHILNPDYTS